MPAVRRSTRTPASRTATRNPRPWIPVVDSFLLEQLLHLVEAETLQEAPAMSQLSRVYPPLAALDTSILCDSLVAVVDRVASNDF